MYHDKCWLLTFSIFLILFLTGIKISVKCQNNQSDNLTILNVLVLDSQGRPVLDVKQDDMRILEDGTPQEITYFSKDELPLRYCIVVDTSGSMNRVNNRNLNVAKAVLNNHKSTDEVALIEFKDQPELLTKFTPDKEVVAKTIESLRGRASRPAALLDAVYLALQYVSDYKPEDRSNRRALILITDGLDHESYYTLGELRKRIDQAYIQIFVIKIDLAELDKSHKPSGPQAQKWMLKEIAKESGGLLLTPKEAELEQVAEGILSTLRKQYVIGYKPNRRKKKDSHEVKVNISDIPGGAKRTAIVRTEYLDK